MLPVSFNYDLMNEYGSVASLETVFKSKKGEELDALWSGEIITLDGEPCLLGAWIGKWNGVGPAGLLPDCPEP